MPGAAEVVSGESTDEVGDRGSDRPGRFPPASDPRPGTTWPVTLGGHQLGLLDGECAIGAGSQEEWCETSAAEHWSCPDFVDGARLSH